MKLSPMIALPLKGMEDVDWSGPLRAYFGSVYGSTDVFSDEVNSINKLRQDVRGAVNDHIGRDLLYKYYAQLELLALRIPISENECRINFTWHDAFTHQSNTQHSIAFEKASLLFNLACINSHIGAETDDLKLAFNRFKDAAGIFTFIIGNFLHAPSTDLSQDTVKALCKLMIAQAQESFVERLLTENSSSAMVPKLAKAASNLYKAAAESLQSVYTDKNWGEKYWHQYCSVKSKYYLSVAHDQNSKTLENSGKYGEAIAHLKIAISNIQEVYKSSVPSQYPSFYDVINTLQDAMKERIVSLEKENDLIYHSTVPNAASIAAIVAVEAATPTPMSELYKDPQELTKLIGKELFEKVIPLSVHQQTSLYSEEKATMLRAEGEKIEIVNEELVSALEFLDLPNALNSLKNDVSDLLSFNKSQGIDSQVNDWADQVAVSGNGSGFTFEALDNTKKTIYDDMKKAEQLLRQEENNYESAKDEFKQNWTQASSATMNSGLLSDISRIKHDLSNATTSDDRLKTMLKGSETDIQILKLGSNNTKLRALFDSIQTNFTPAGNSSSLLDLDQTQDDGTVDGLLDQTRHYLDSLQIIRKERDARFLDFKDKVHKDDISGILVLNNKNPDIQESVFKSELAKFQPFQSEFDESIKRQQTLLKELTVTWKKVLENKSVRNKNLQKEELKSRQKALVDRFHSAYNAWRDIEQGLNKAHEFYQKLLAFTKSTLSNAQDFVSNREEEAFKLRNIASASSSQNSQEFLRDQLARMSISSTQSPQPPQSLKSTRDSVGSTGYEPTYSSPVSVSLPVSQTMKSSISDWNNNSSFDRSQAPPAVPAKPATPSFPSQTPSYADYSKPSHLQYTSAPPNQPQYTSMPSQSSYQQPVSNTVYTAPNYGQPYSQPSYQQPASTQSTYQTPLSTQSNYHQPPIQSSYQQPPVQPFYQQASSTQSGYPSYQHQPSYGNYQTQLQYSQPYQQQPPPPQGQYGTLPQHPQNQPYQGSNSLQNTGGQYAYGGTPVQKDYSKMPPPPPPPGQNQPGQGYYR